MGRAIHLYARGLAVTAVLAGGVVVTTTATTSAAPAPGTIELVSPSHLGGPSNDHSRLPVISADGNVVAFRSQATNLVSPSGPVGIYVRNLATGTTTLAIADPTPATVNDITDLDLSGDGRYLAFTSRLATLVPGDTNGQPDAFVLDLATGTTIRTSVLSDGSQLAAGGGSTGITDDGTRAGFVAWGNNCATRRAFVRELGPTPQSVLVDTCVVSAKFAGGGIHMVLRKEATTPDPQQPTVLRELATGGTSPMPGTYVYDVSADGSTVLLSDSTDSPVRLIAHHVPSGTSEVVDVDSAGERFTAGWEGQGLSADGRFVVFAGRAFDEDITAVWLRDRWAGTTTRVSPPLTSATGAYDGASATPAIDADGTVVAFKDNRSGGGPRYDDILAAGHAPAAVAPPTTPPTTTAPPPPPTTLPDTTPPDATVASPRPNQALPAAPLVFSGEATDDRGVTYVRVAVRNTATQEWWGADGWQMAYTSWNATLSNPGGTTTTWSSGSAGWTPTSGTYAVQVIAVDQANNVDPTKPWVPFAIVDDHVDTTPPDATVSQPTEGDTYHQSPVLLQGQASDDVGVAAVRVAIRNTTTLQWWNGSGWQSAYNTTDATLGDPGGPATGWAYSWSPPGAGSYALQVAAVDLAGNVDPTKPWVRFTTTSSAIEPPNGTVTTPSPGGTLVGAPPLQLAGYAQDDTGVAAVRVAIRNTTTLQWWNGTAWQAAFTTTDGTLWNAGGLSTGWTYLWTPPGPGGYALQITAVDEDGLVDPTKPWVPFTVAP